MFAELNTTVSLTIVLEFAFSVVLDVIETVNKTVVNRHNFASADLSQITESPQLEMGHLLMSHAREVVHSFHEIICGMYKL